MIPGQREVSIPGLVRIKPGALDRVGIYLRRANYQTVALIHSDGLPKTLINRLQAGLDREGISPAHVRSACEASREEAGAIASELPVIDCVLGLGGGKAIDTAKYIGFLSETAMLSIPTSLSNDGFCSPQSSLTESGKRVSMKSSMPSGVVVDTAVCLQAPKSLWLAGIGDLVSKLTAVKDWKLAFHHRDTPVDDFAALLSDASVFQFMGQPDFKLDGVQRLATALMLNGVSMSICGSSRPASGSEHLISHALDAFSARPRLHGFQVGMATYLISHLHGTATEAIRTVFTKTGFWDAIIADPFSRREWRLAIQQAPSMKSEFFTILSMRDWTDSLMEIIDHDRHLKNCFVE
ncbi:MAG: iron-containing alcohol dehydrogenase family protein [Fuerstiella sp.]